MTTFTTCWSALELLALRSFLRTGPGAARGRFRLGRLFHQSRLARDLEGQSNCCSVC